MITGWRVDSGFSVPRGSSVWDVLAYEMFDLGNDLRFDVRYIEICKSLSAKCCQWVTFTRKACLRYGSNPERVEFEYPLIIAQDGDGGYLVIDLTEENLYRGR